MIWFRGEQPEDPSTKTEPVKEGESNRVTRQRNTPISQSSGKKKLSKGRLKNGEKRRARTLYD